MFHLLVMACTVGGTCAERWLPQGDNAQIAACEAGATAVASPWLAAHSMRGEGQRCAPTDTLPTLTLAPVASGVWVHLGAPGTASADNHGEIANSGVVTGPRGVAVIDPGGTRAEAEALLAAIRRLTPLPVTTVVLTHAHPDHSLGAELFHEAGAQVIANAALPASLAARRATWESGYRETLGEAAWHGSAFIAPDKLLAEGEAVGFGGDSLDLTPQPPGHSDADLTAWHGASRTLFTGDLLFRGTTPVLDGSIIGWLAWLGKAPEPPPDHVVPGHGPVAAGWVEGSAETRSYLEALAQTVRAAIAEGRSLSEAIPQVVEAMRPLAADLGDFDATTARDAASAFKELEWE
ncbi:quinoprotein relay system zinc metallohydrolase 2 [Paracoccus suum]|uniref:Quinoprotein relay system zinc metallohydrolase 2 n=1 Tax=Paracoccus suum TaxID=2259340 RepID=A0A344PLQ8_9RHOB|nr:quinoprotein relay system zinc metallohydrolase 2 [Paracoccus suum]AXC50313.1 quinoprotein relay system zinc metallohydrolase 2 [Paracoccus suum]